MAHDNAYINIENANRFKSIMWTIGVHALLLLLFFFIKYSLPSIPAVEEFGMEVNLGTSDDGSGTDQPMAVDAPAADKAATQYQSATQQQSETRDMMRSDDPNAPAIAPVNATNAVRHQTINNNTNRNNNTQRNTNTTPAPAQRPRYLYNGGTGPGGNSAATNQPGSSEGNTAGDRDRGVPGGIPGAANYTGSPGNGTGGISHTLSGRNISPRQFVAEFNEGGKVVIRIKVDRDGNIISKAKISSPNNALYNIALQKLSQAKFSANPNAPPEQFGIITIVFKTRS